MKSLNEGFHLMALFLGSVFVMWLGLVLVAEFDIDTAHNKAIIAEAKADCKERKGQWITNPQGWWGLKIEGQGCNLDYERRAKLSARR